MKSISTIYFHTLFDSCKEGIIFFNERLVVRYLNSSFLRMFGYRKSDFSDKHITSLPNFNLYKRILESRIARFYRKKAEKWEMEVQTSHAKKIWIEISSSPAIGDNNELLGSIFIISDITEKKILENRYRQENSEYKTLFETHPTPLIEEDFSEIRKFIDTLELRKISDLKNFFRKNPGAKRKIASLGKIVNVNLEMLKLFESKSKKDFIGPLLPFINNDQALEKFEQEILNYARNITDFEKSETRILPSGKRIKINSKSIIVPGSTANWKKVLVSFTDQTNHAEIEEELKNKNKDLIIFIYKVSHDMKSPLASIIGLGNVAKMDIKDPVSLKYIEMISQSAQRLESFLSNLLNNFAFSGRVPQENKVFVKKLIVSTIAGIRYNPIYQNVTITLKSNQKKPITSDSKILHHIFQNLIDNAAKYKNSPEGPHKINIFISDTLTNWLKVTINDTGCGMNEETKNHIFELFFRGSDQSTGAGLGLYIVKNSLEKLKGKIEVKTFPGKGSSFIVYLPKKKQF